MKITSKDCVDKIVVEVGGKAADWKRVSKRTVGSAIVRVFKNEPMHEMVDAVEENGKLRIMADKPYAAPVTKKTSKIFSFSISEMVGMGIPMVTFNGRPDGTIPDELSSAEIKEVEKIFEDIGVESFEEMENHYTMDPSTNI